MLAVKKSSVCCFKEKNRVLVNWIGVEALSIHKLKISSNIYMKYQYKIIIKIYMEFYEEKNEL